MCTTCTFYSNTRAGQTAINHNRCLLLTAALFFGRVKAAQALTEDFDSVVLEFGRGCPCKIPPLKSTGKAHLNTATHDKAFKKPDGKFFGMSVRAAFELSVEVVNVHGAQQIGGDDAAEEENDAEQRPEFDDFDEMDERLEVEPPAIVDDGADDDLSGMVAE